MPAAHEFRPLDWTFVLGCPCPNLSPLSPDPSSFSHRRSSCHRHCSCRFRYHYPWSKTHHLCPCFSSCRHPGLNPEDVAKLCLYQVQEQPPAMLCPHRARNQSSSARARRSPANSLCNPFPHPSTEPPYRSLPTRLRPRNRSAVPEHD